MDARVKLLLAVGFILTTALTPIGAWPVYILLIAIVISVGLLSELGISFILKRSMLALPFMLAALPIFFTLPGTTLFQFTLGSWTVNATIEGMERFVSIVLKSWISVQAAVILAASTTFPSLLVAMRAIHIPRLLVAIFGLMWRYLFVMVDEALRLMRARASRSSHSNDPRRKTGGTIPWRARVAGGMAGNLFLRSYERSDRIYMAMVSRGYDGEIRSSPLPGLSTVDWIVLVSGFALYLFLVSLGFLV
jgi:cobalt/nickel transport system permease protein